VKLLILLFFTIACSHVKKTNYPPQWWQEVPKDQLHWWEVSPASVSKDQVVLSKRNQLGLLSNFAHTPFQFKGKRYQSMEGFWQAMKYPELIKDPRSYSNKWSYQRGEVESMVGFTAKKAGDEASQIMRELKIDWVSFEKVKMPYRTSIKGPHYQLIRKAMEAKLHQNMAVKKVLLATGKLTLVADHHTKTTDPPAWKYYQIWMEIRESLQSKGKYLK
jgi:predicted NAD-dependent protein-ADP-ribosyltransferase YbiA (DUF1768 family)